MNPTESGRSREQQQPQTDSFIKGVCLCVCACVCVGKLFNFFCNFPFHFVLPWRWLRLRLWHWSCSWSRSYIVLALSTVPLCGQCLWQIHEWAIFILHFSTDPHSKNTHTHTHTLGHSHIPYTHTLFPSPPFLARVHLTTFCANWSIYLFWSRQMQQTAWLI